MTYSQIITTRGETFQEGMVVVCIHDHQVHDKLNYLNRYTVHSVDVDDLGQALVEVTTSAQKSELFPIEWFVPASTYDLEATMRMDDKAMADPQPVVKRTDPDVRMLPFSQAQHYTSAAESAYDEADEARVKQAQQFENVPDMTVAMKLARTGKNPKQQYGDKKPALSLAPMSATIAQVEAQLDGKLKYGWVNWRVNRIEAHTYIEAALRHLRLYENGENYARDTKVYNLGAVMACCAILIDAELHGMLDDNRRISPATCDMLHNRGEEMTKHLQQMQRDRDAANG